MIIECQRLFDGEQTHDQMRIVIEGEHIARVEPIDAWQGQPNDMMIRCNFAMPGLIDSQVHVVGYDEGPPEGRPFEPHTAFVQLLLYAGITTVRDGGNTLEALGYLRHWSDQHHGPRIFSSGPVLDDVPLTWAFSRLVQHESDVERQVALLASEGVHFIKAYRNIRPNLLPVIVRAAQRHKLRVAAHVEVATAREACRAGVHVLERLVNAVEGSWVTEFDSEQYKGASGRLRRWAHVDLDSSPVRELIELICTHHVAVCPTLLASRRRALLDEVINEPYLDYMVAVMPYHRYFKGMRSAIGYAIGKRFLNRHMPFPKLDRAAQREIDQGWERLREFMRRLHEQGVPLVAGSDTPTLSVVPGFGLHQELREWVACGIPALDVLAAATARAADVLGINCVGRIQPSAYADLLLLQDDPVADMQALSRPDNQVICRGQLIDRVGLKDLIQERIREANASSQ